MPLLVVAAGGEAASPSGSGSPLLLLVLPLGPAAAAASGSPLLLPLPRACLLNLMLNGTSSSSSEGLSFTWLAAFSIDPPCPQTPASLLTLRPGPGRASSCFVAPPWYCMFQLLRALDKTLCYLVCNVTRSATIQATSTKGSRPHYRGWLM